MTRSALRVDSGKKTTTSVLVSSSRYVHLSRIYFNPQLSEAVNGCLRLHSDTLRDFKQNLLLCVSNHLVTAFVCQDPI